MAFSFGAPAPGATPAAAAPAAGGFSFGATATPAPAPAATGGFGASSTTPAPAPAAGGFAFSAAAATPAPAPAATGGFSFGATAATPAPAPAATSGGLFGGATASPAPAATGGFSFGGAPAPAPAVGGGSIFGAPAASAGQQPQQKQQQPLSGHTPYASLPPDAQRAIDAIHDVMMKHRRTMASVRSMAPALLSVPGTATPYLQSGVGGVGGAIAPAVGPSSAGFGGGRRATTPATLAVVAAASPADAAAGPPSPLRGGVGRGGGGYIDPALTPLPRQLASISADVQALQGRVDQALAEAQGLHVESAQASTGAVMYGQWPVEALAVRRGVALSAPPTKDAAQLEASEAVRRMIDVQAANVDRIENLPSPYLWNLLDEFERRLRVATHGIDTLRRQLDVSEEAASAAHAEDVDAYEPGGGGGARRLASLIRSQNDGFLRVAAEVARAHDALEELRSRYRRAAMMVRGGDALDDPFARADAMEMIEERKVQERIAAGRMAAAAAAGGGPAATAAAGTTTSAPPGGLFGAAPAPSGGLFSAPAPAPSGGGLFGGTPAPAPSTGGMFGASPAPAPAAGGLFGATPAPAPAATGGLFGSSPAPAAGGFGGFGALSSTPTLGGSKPKSKSRSGRRR